MRILWIPHTGWHIPQRAQLFCRALAERHEVHVTDMVADFRRPRDYLSLRYLRNFVYRRRNDGPITVHGVPRISPAIFSRPLRRLNTLIFQRLVDWLIGRYRYDAVVGTFVVPPPRSAERSTERSHRSRTAKPAPRLVFDLFDDNVAYWQRYGVNAAYADEIAATEQAYLQQADAVVAASSILAEQAGQRGAAGSVYHIPNGIAIARYASAKRVALRANFAPDRQIVGMLGNHDKSSEIEKVLDAAAALRDEPLQFVIAGRGEALALARRRIAQEGLQHVHLSGYVAPNDAPDMIAAFDVGLCPYPKSAGADASSPMRLLMYAAAGLPTVCTDLLAVRQLAFPNVVLVDDGSPALVEGIRTALAMPRCVPAALTAYDLPHVVTRYEQVLAGVTDESETR
jgi:glycosyltransferase involved in cell wall biosynthesis